MKSLSMPYEGRRKAQTGSEINKPSIFFHSFNHSQRAKMKKLGWWDWLKQEKKYLNKKG